MEWIRGIVVAMTMSVNGQLTAGVLPLSTRRAPDGQLASASAPVNWLWYRS